MDKSSDFSAFPSVNVAIGETPDEPVEDLLHMSMVSRDLLLDAGLQHEPHDFPAPDESFTPRMSTTIFQQSELNEGCRERTQGTVSAILATPTTPMSPPPGASLGDALHGAPFLSLSQQNQPSGHVDVTQIANTQGLIAPRSVPLMTNSIKPPPRAGFFRELSEYPFIMPVGPPLNFTIADILVILPLWHKSIHMCYRFQNNGLSSGVHVTILQEHRHITLPKVEVTRAKDGITDQYRQTMRKMDPSWRKTAHKAPSNWDMNNLTVNQFLPDSARDAGYTAPDPVSFKEMMNGIKKLPQGPDAGDLTRALEFALRNQKIHPDGKAEDYLFPDDVHSILAKIGYTVVTKDHTDRAIIILYEKMLSQITNAQRKRRYELEAAGLPARPLKRQHVAKAKTLDETMEQQYTMATDAARVPLRGGWRKDTTMDLGLQLDTAAADASPHPQSGRAGVPPSHIHMPVPVSSSQLFSRAKYFMNSPGPTLEPIMSIEDSLAQNEELTGTNFAKHPYGTPTTGGDNNTGFTELFSDVEAQLEHSSARLQTEGAEEGFSSGNEMDTLVAQHQDHDFFGLLTPSPEQTSILLRLEESMESMDPIVWNNRTHYPNTQLLRDCTEAEDVEDHSDLARAARWCRNPHNHAWDYVVGHVDIVLGLAAVLGNAEM
jgi:hypothetical protein